MKQASKAWINAAIALDKDSALKILCPECRGSFLQILDCDLNCNNSYEGFERYIFCGKCGAKNIVLYRHKMKDSVKGQNVIPAK